MMQNKLKIKKKLIAVVLSSFVGVFLFATSVDAFSLESVAKEAVLQFIGWFIALLVYVVGALTSVIISAVMWIASYNNFVNEPVVIEGWKQIRDLSNMFFILILLVIAFATILRMENYSVKRLLPKLVIMAVLINFSRMICGVIIEIAQVFMLTFIGALEGNGSNFVQIMKLTDHLQLGESLERIKKGEDIDFLASIAGYVFALIFTMISLVTVAAYLLVLVMRIVMIWVYVVLSPLAYLLAAFPQGQGYSSRWWSEFSKYVITGPVLAFFLWLAFYSVQIGSGIQISGAGGCYGENNTLCTDNFLQFILGIAFLLGGLKITSEIGGIVGSAAGKGLDTIQKGKNVTVKYSKSKVGQGAKAMGRGALRGTGAFLQNAPVISKKDSFNKAGQFMSTWSRDLSKARADDKASKRLKTLEKMGIKEDSQEKLSDLRETSVGRGLAKTKSYATKGAVALGAAATGGVAGLGAIGVYGAAKKFKIMNKGTKADQVKEYEEKIGAHKAYMNQVIEDAKVERDVLLEVNKSQFDDGQMTAEQFNAENKAANREYNSAVKEATKAYEDMTKNIKNDYDVGVEHGYSDTRAALAKGVADRAKKKETAKTKSLLESIADGGGGGGNNQPNQPNQGGTPS